MKRFSTYSFILVCLAMKMVTLSSCANMLPPGGGLIDSFPPKLVAATVKDSAVNVSTNTKLITLTFDEYIQLKEAFSNLIISPSPSQTNPPIVDGKLRNVTIRFKDSLEANTTYSFNFGNALQDVNENNIAKKFIYAFSTGKKMDYNTYGGRVLLAETGKPIADSSLIIILHKNLDDTAVKKSSPRYYTTMDGKGEFMFHNLPAGKFAVYVVSSRFTRQYTDSTDYFAFRSTPIIIDGNTPRDSLYAFEEAKRKPIGSTATVRPTAAKNEDKRLKYSIGFENGQQDILGNLVITFNRKITSFDSTKFTLNDTLYHKMSGYSFSLDSTKTKLELSYKWKESTPFRLLVAKDAAIDSAGVALTKNDTILFFTKKESDYGLVRLRFTNLDLSKNPVLQMVVNDKITESIPLTQPEFQRKLYRPGTYDIRILYDTNKNGVWDPGKFFGEKRQPEIVRMVQKQFAIRGNWDNEATIVL